MRRVLHTAPYVWVLLVLFLPGCVSNTSMCAWSHSREALCTIINDIPVEPNKENIIDVFGSPTFIVSTTDGEFCVWRKPWASGMKGHNDWIMKFDKDGNSSPGIRSQMSSVNVYRVLAAGECRDEVVERAPDA